MGTVLGTENTVMSKTVTVPDIQSLHPCGVVHVEIMATFDSSGKSVLILDPTKNKFFPLKRLGSPTAIVSEGYSAETSPITCPEMQQSQDPGKTFIS